MLVPRHLLTSLAPVVVILFVGGTPGPSSAQTTSASGLLTACGTPEEAWISFCNGYVQAIFDTANLEHTTICAPPGTTRAEMAGHVYSGLNALGAIDDGRVLADLSGAAASIMILHSRYPCE